MNEKFRWKTYRNYRLILWAWMMGDVTVVFVPVEISHHGFYFYGVIYILSAIFIGIPLVYSEICIAQYTNCDVISMWNYFPLFRSVGYGTVFLVLIKITYILVLCSWYLNYTFHAAIDPPPWFSCDEFNDTKCMVKRVNTSIFQHCIETQELFKDCDMKTASNCFFEQEIGENNTMQFKCVFQWKLIINNCLMSFVMFILFMRKEKNIRIVIKVLVAYVCFVSFILFCIALSASGAWYATKMSITWEERDFNSCIVPLTRGVLSLGTGYGMISFLSNDVPFRSPATMTSRAVVLFAVFFSLMFSLIIYSGIRTMSYYHGQEESVLEVGNYLFFLIFASVSEIMIYFERPFWSFLWFSTIFLCLFINLLILLYYLHELLANTYYFAQRYKKISCATLIIFVCLMSCPIFCSDLTGAFKDFTEIVQLINSLLFSISLYWIYGYNTHNIDIIFMIGVKAGYFWKIVWCINPIFLMILVYMRCTKLDVNEYSSLYKIESLGLPCNILLLYFLFSIYGFILVVGTLYELRIFYNSNTKLCNIFHAAQNWGPNDRLLFRSRKMFVPEIMTREFLYRQVRIHGYLKNKRKSNMKELDDKSRSISTEKMEWSALTSN